MPVALVGSDAARAVHGRSDGADVALLGASPKIYATSLVQSLAALGATGRSQLTGRLDALAELATTDSEHPLVVAATDLRIEAPALLDLLDRPGDQTAALLAEHFSIEAPPQHSVGLELASLVRVGADGSLIESLGTGWHQVTNPNRISVGMLRVAAADRVRAAELWSDAADLDELRGLDIFDAALLVLVRGGVKVSNRPLGYFTWSRGEVGQSGAKGSAWQQRLRTASRGGDGLFSTFVIRPLSRRCTAIGLKLNLSPNLLTLISLIIGMATAALIWTGQPLAWVAAAVTLQIALIVDCMDGEIARFTRNFSTLGAWLDGVGDRVKEYAVFAALAAVATGQGDQQGWLLAIIAMAVVTARHLEDYSFNEQLGPSKISRPELLALTQARDGGPDGARTTLAASSTARQRRTFWVKKLIHLPIAERYAILSLGLLTFRPVWVLLAAIVFSAFALLWTQGGRLLKEIIASRRSRRVSTPSEASTAAGVLDHQLDLGLLARAAGRIRGLGFVPGLVSALLLWLATIAAICVGHGWLALGLAVAAAVLIGMACRIGLHHRLGWQALPLIWSVEAAAFAALIAHGPLGAYVFAFLAVVAYRRYDLIYSLKLNARTQRRLRTSVPRPLVAWGLGAEGRIIVLTAFLAIFTTADVDLVIGFRVVLLVAAVLSLGVYLGKSWSRWRPEPRQEQELIGKIKS